MSAIVDKTIYYLKTAECGCGDMPKSERNSWSEVVLQGTTLLTLLITTE